MLRSVRIYLRYGKYKQKKIQLGVQGESGIEALKETSTLSELSKKYELAPEVISRWKSELLKNAGTVFSNPPRSDEEHEKEEICGQMFLYIIDIEIFEIPITADMEKNHDGYYLRIRKLTRLIPVPFPVVIRNLRLLIIESHSLQKSSTEQKFSTIFVLLSIRI